MLYNIKKLLNNKLILNSKSFALIPLIIVNSNNLYSNFLLRA